MTRHQLLAASEGFRQLAQVEEADIEPWLPTIELVHEVSHPWSQHEGLHDLHQGAVKAWQAIEDTDEGDSPTVGRACTLILRYVADTSLRRRRPRLLKKANSPSAIDARQF